jgi:hypothetical protein
MKCSRCNEEILIVWTAPKWCMSVEKISKYQLLFSEFTRLCSTMNNEEENVLLYAECGCEKGNPLLTQKDVDKISNSEFYKKHGDRLFDVI